MLKRLGLVVRAMLGALAFTLAGCASMYFQDAGPPPPIRHEIGKLPFSEYWTGIVFNGEKIGFTHFTIRKDPDTENFEIQSEASFVLRFLGIEKKIQLRSRDVIGADLSMVEFAYRYNIDGSELQLTGRRQGDELAATIVTGGTPNEQRLPVKGKLYPSSVINLYPVLYGLEIGREHNYRVYNGQTQSLAEVTQRIAGYERSDLFLGNAFKVETAMGGQSVTSWIGPDGRLVFELAMRGVMISYLEDAGSATRYLALASLNKKESLIEYSLVRPDRPIDNPRAVSGLRVALSGGNRLPPSDAWQHCATEEQEIRCAMGRAISAGPAPAEPPSEALRARYLQPSVAVQSRDPAIRRLADEIVGGSASTEDRIARILRWLEHNVEKAPVDVFSALDVLQQRKAECQGHAYLYVALARAAGIPTRMVNGLVYSEEFRGFLYHSWAESLVGANWQVIDPTFGQAAADATHIKLVEGENLAELIPLMEWVGKVNIRVLEVEHRN
ncbi:MAG TPA: transglutaminase domain-containing protein [Burkholderiales bacterium]|nr:transglutaminase domain-containing protein [Burkholderiales bacterium]